MYEQFTGNPPKQQDILNALPARNRPERKRIPVQARIMWEHDGEEWIDGHALRLDENGPVIFVEFGDARKKFAGVWLRPDDVQWDGKQ